MHPTMIKFNRSKHEVGRGQDWLLNHLPAGICSPSSGFMELLSNYCNRLVVRYDKQYRAWQIWELAGAEKRPEYVLSARKLDNRIIDNLHARDMARYASKEQAWQKLEEQDRDAERAYQDSLDGMVERGIKACEEYARKSPYVMGGYEPGDYKAADLL